MCKKIVTRMYLIKKKQKLKGSETESQKSDNLS